MRIGEIAERSGLPAKTIRHYEAVGLIRPERSDNGYRRFTDADLHKLTFVAQARSLGFALEDCRVLLELYEDRQRASGDVKRVAEEHLARLERKLAEIESMRITLGRLVERCHGDDRPECPIIDRLASVPGRPGTEVTRGTSHPWEGRPHEPIHLSSPRGDFHRKESPT